MHLTNSFVLAVFGLVCGVMGYPQSDRELADGTKYIEGKYYSKDAPGKIPFDNPQDIDNAKEEYEGYGSKVLSVYDGLQKKTSDVFNPKPVIDNTKEHEKYGNNGDNLKGVSQLVVSAMSVVSNLVNKIVDAPVNAVTAVVGKANGFLNQIGGKLVGLAK